MRLMLAAIFSACCRTIFRSVPTIRTAIGVDEPKLMTVVTMSPGSKPKVAQVRLSLRLRRRQAPLLQPLGQPGDHVLGQDLAEPLAELVQLDPAVLRQRDAQLAVVGPAHEQHHVVDAEVGRHLADVAHRDLRCSRAFASRSISSRHLTAICRVSSKFDPGGGRNRSTNCPESICGNSSVPTCSPSTHRTSTHAPR